MPMPRIFIASPGNADLFFWNLTAAVGLKSPNLRADVDLVQFGYFAMSQAKISGDAAFGRLIATVVPGAPYSGEPSDPLTLSILAHQKTRGGTQDGHVSPIHGTSINYKAPDRPHTFMIVVLVDFMRELVGADFPRIDKHAKCPIELKKVVRSCFGT
jgi:hypothetical protein